MLATGFTPQQRNCSASKAERERARCTVRCSRKQTNTHTHKNLSCTIERARPSKPPLQGCHARHAGPGRARPGAARPLREAAAARIGPQRGCRLSAAEAAARRRQARRVLTRRTFLNHRVTLNSRYCRTKNKHPFRTQHERFPKHPELTTKPSFRVPSPRSREESNGHPRAPHASRSRPRSAGPTVPRAFVRQPEPFRPLPPPPSSAPLRPRPAHPEAGGARPCGGSPTQRAVTGHQGSELHSPPLGRGGHLASL